ncbi:MAG: hypothetical protein C0501_30235 [Isosphaera sp.]|nr:hypothetical protein [Isosphaera sp.]
MTAVALAMMLVCCFFVLLIVPVVLFVLTAVFRQACVLCGLPRPSVLTATGVILVTWVLTKASDALVGVVVTETCQAAGLPEWEAWVIAALLLIPIDLLITSALHAGLLNVSFGKGIEVWFVQTLMYLVIAAAGGFVAAAVLVALNP